nr:MAG TPA: hypothetical protein [Caudoviricetes sp.]
MFHPVLKLFAHLNPLRLPLSERCHLASLKHASNILY